MIGSEPSHACYYCKLVKCSLSAIRPRSLVPRRRDLRLRMSMLHAKLSWRTIGAGITAGRADGEPDRMAGAAPRAAGAHGPGLCREAAMAEARGECVIRRRRPDGENAPGRQRAASFGEAVELVDAILALAA